MPINPLSSFDPKHLQQSPPLKGNVQQTPKNIPLPPQFQQPTNGQAPTQVKSLFKRFIELPDKYFAVKILFDIGILALGIISIVSILIFTQGQGLILYALIPAGLVGTFGGTLLISDLACTPKLAKIADTIAAITVPFILLGISAALFAGALAVSTNAMIFASPLFIIGLLTIGLSLVSLDKITFNYFRYRNLSNEVPDEIEDQANQDVINSDEPLNTSANDLTLDLKKRHSLNLLSETELKKLQERGIHRTGSLPSDLNSKDSFPHHSMNSLISNKSMYYDANSDDSFYTIESNSSSDSNENTSSYYKSMQSLTKDGSHSDLSTSHSIHTPSKTHPIFPVRSQYDLSSLPLSRRTSTSSNSFEVTAKPKSRKNGRESNQQHHQDEGDQENDQDNQKKGKKTKFPKK